MGFASLVLSNRLDRLAAVLARVLDGGDSFSERVILVPSAEMKGWLLVELARFSLRRGVAGLKVLAWREGIKYLLNQPGSELSYVELYLHVYRELKASEDEEVRAYAAAARLVDLAEMLTDLFVLYGYYGSEFGEGDWQGKIWDRIFGEEGRKTPRQLLGEGLRVKGKVYVFGCDHLPPVVWEGLFGLESLDIFHFSPCASYWADFCTGGERRAIEKKARRKNVSLAERVEMQEYLLDAHPLLASWGKVGRETLKVFDEHDLDVNEAYDFLERGESSLNVLQRDLLLHKVSKIPKDLSVRINKTGASRLREAQVLYGEIMRAHQEGISFSEMLVLAPDVQVYAPLIELALSESERPIPYRMSGVNALAGNLAWQGFKRLLELSQSRWDAETLLALFENGAFRAKQGWDLERLDEIRSWVKDASIRWGKTKEHKEEILSGWLGRSLPSASRGTWEEAADRWIYSLICAFPEEEIPPYSLVQGIDLSDADGIEELLELLASLQKDLSPLADGTLKSPKEWAECFSSLFTAYFGEEELGAFEEIIYSLRKAAMKIDEKIPFSVLAYLFTRTEKGSIGANRLHAVSIASFEPGSIVPCKALFLLGQEEESFPRRDSPSSLDRGRRISGATPFRSDVDRYLFLQAVCSAEKRVVISYSHISPEDGKEQEPSILIREWMSYAKEMEVTVHPSFPWHRRCLEEAKCQPMSLSDQRAAAVFHGEKRPLQFFPSFALPSSPAPLTQSKISLKQLKKAFSHPWKCYLQEKYRLWIQEEEKEDWSDFELDWVQRAKLLKTALVQPLEAVIGKLEKKQMFPAGLFGEAARKQVEKMLEERKGHLQDWGATPDQLFPLYLREALEDGFAPLQVPFRDSFVTLLGEASFCSPRGPIHFGEDSFAALLKNWPEYLASLCALQGHEIFCLRSGKIRVVEKPMQALQECLEIYALALQIPLPLVPQWSDALVRKCDPEELAKKMEVKRVLIEDPIYDWVLSRIEPPNVQALTRDFGPYFQKHLAALLELYPTGRSHAKV